MSVERRKRFYEKFARAANDRGAAWAVLSGLQGYPHGIGRDLDVTCRTRSDADSLCEIFVECLHDSDFHWIVFPSPVWGRRILGVARDYSTVELHIVDRVRVATISLRPNWQNLEYRGGLFPTDSLAHFVKRCLSPALAGSDDWPKKCSGVSAVREMPWWLRPAAGKLRAGFALSGWDRARLFGSYFLTSPIASVGNFIRWRVRHGSVQNYPAAPVYLAADAMGAESFVEVVQQRLSEVFTGVVCADNESLKRIRELQARQRLVFLTRERADVPDVKRLTPTLKQEEELTEFLVEEFCRFNERWRPKT